jgi:heme a synthase
MAAMGSRGFRTLVLVTLAMAIALALISAHIRLLNAGLGCNTWPDCYGVIGPAQATQAYTATLAGEASQRAAPVWATGTHRVLASVLGVAILLIAFGALRARRTGPLLPGLLVAVMIGLSVLGVWSAGLHRPAVVMANFAGGLALVGLLAALLLRSAGQRPSAAAPRASRLAPWALAGLGVVAVQALLGGLVSAYFAGAACQGFPGCSGAWLPPMPVGELLAHFGMLPVDAAGRVIPVEGSAGLHMLHRLLGFAAAAMLGVIAWRALQAGYVAHSVLLLVLTLLVTALGLALVRDTLTPGLVLTHYALALALLLVLLSLHQAAGKRVFVPATSATATLN